MKATKSRFVLTFTALVMANLVFQLLKVILPISILTAPGKDGANVSNFFSTYGNYLTLSYVSPFLGGLLADFVFGRRITIVTGFLVFIIGVLLEILRITDVNITMTFSIFFLGVGIGFLKPCLTADIGRLSPKYNEDSLQKTYKLLYICLSIGFFVTSIIGGCLHNLFSFLFILKTSLALLCIGFGLFLLSCKKEEFLEKQPSNCDKIDLQPPHNGNLIFLSLLFFGFLFFIGYSQISTSFIFYGYKRLTSENLLKNFPISWINGFSFAGMFLFIWPLKKLFSKIKFNFFSLNLSILLTFISFLSVYILDLLHINGNVLFLLILILSISLITVSDYFIRPTLFSAVHKYTSKKMHSSMTAAVYIALGFGIKIGCTLASHMETWGENHYFFAMTISFSSVFALSIIVFTLLQKFTKINKPIAD